MSAHRPALAPQYDGPPQRYLREHPEWLIQERPKRVSERNWAILLAYVLDKQTLWDIGREHTLTPERIRQILHRVALAALAASGNVPSAEELQSRPLSAQERDIIHDARYPCALRLRFALALLAARSPDGA